MRLKVRGTFLHAKATVRDFFVQSNKKINTVYRSRREYAPKVRGTCLHAKGRCEIFLAKATKKSTRYTAPVEGLRLSAGGTSDTQKDVASYFMAKPIK